MNTEFQRSVLHVKRVAALLQSMERRFRSAPGDILVREYCQTVEVLMPAIGAPCSERER